MLQIASLLPYEYVFKPCDFILEIVTLLLYSTVLYYHKITRFSSAWLQLLDPSMAVFNDT